MKNKIREKCINNETFFGGFALLGSVAASCAMANSGYDFIMLDMQHGYFNRDSMMAAVHSMRGATPFVRVADLNAGLINDVLDCGAPGVIVPMINTREEAEKCVAYSKYYPLGARSVGPGGTIFHGNEYTEKANDEVMLMVMIETPEAVERAEEILSVPGVDMCLIGAFDLSLILGCGMNDQPMRDAIAKVVEAGKKHNVVIGSSVLTPKGIEQWLDLGLQFYFSSHDLGMIMDNSKIAVAQFKEVLGK